MMLGMSWSFFKSGKSYKDAISGGGGGHRHEKGTTQGGIVPQSATTRRGGGGPPGDVPPGPPPGEEVPEWVERLYEWMNRRNEWMNQELEGLDRRISELEATVERLRHEMEVDAIMNYPGAVNVIARRVIVDDARTFLLQRVTRQEDITWKEYVGRHKTVNGAIDALARQLDYRRPLLESVTPAKRGKMGSFTASESEKSAIRAVVDDEDTMRIILGQSQVRTQANEAMHVMPREVLERYLDGVLSDDKACLRRMYEMNFYKTN